MRSLAIFLAMTVTALAVEPSQLTDEALRAAYVDICVKQQTMNGGSMPAEFVAECDALRAEWGVRQDKLKKNTDAADRQKLKEILGTKK